MTQRYKENVNTIQCNATQHAKLIWEKQSISWTPDGAFGSGANDNSLSVCFVRSTKDLLLIGFTHHHQLPTRRCTRKTLTFVLVLCTRLMLLLLLSALFSILSHLLFSILLCYHPHHHDRYHPDYSWNDHCRRLLRLRYSSYRYQRRNIQAMLQFFGRCFSIC